MMRAPEFACETCAFWRREDRNRGVCCRKHFALNVTLGRLVTLQKDTCPAHERKKVTYERAV